MLGFPIRTSSDPRSVDSSPRHIAASHVLHRLPVPRHPPCALKHLQTQKPKIIKSLKLHNKQTPTCPERQVHARLMLATTIHKSNTTPHHQDGATTTHPQRESRGSVVSKPNSVSGDSFTGPSRSLGSRTGENVCCAPNRQPTTGAGDLLPTTDSHECGGGGTILVLLRKEVIQPHLPVRLPCYDFVPIADPTFDGSLPYGLGHRLRVLPTFMT